MREILTVSLGAHTTRVSASSREEVLRHEAPAAVYVGDANTRTLVPADGPWVELMPGEAHKDWSSVSAILDAALGAGLGRDGLIVGIGGGVVCDVAAFAASVYQRGIAVSLVPTSLLAMVDASVGGKTGINYGGLKNMVGSFHPAREVRICVSLLDSLPEREFRSGLAEVIKSAMLGDEELLRLLEDDSQRVTARNHQLLSDLVRRSLMVKKQVVEQDFTESGIRAHLNLGHTFGHGLESAAGFGEWTHGEAVIWGVARALDAGVRLGHTDPGYRDRCMDLFASYGYRLTAAGVRTRTVLAAIAHDKKKKDGVVRFVLQRDLGDTFVSPLPEDVLTDIVASGIEKEKE